MGQTAGDPARPVAVRRNSCGGVPGAEDESMNFIPPEYRSWKIEYDDVVDEQYGCPEPASDCDGSDEAEETTSHVSDPDSDNSVASDDWVDGEGSDWDGDHATQLDRDTILEMFARSQDAWFDLEVSEDTELASVTDGRLNMPYNPWRARP